MRILAVLAMAATSLGCVTVELTMTPQAIHHQVPSLREKGEATVDLQPSGTYRLTQDRVLRARFPSGRTGLLRWLTPDQQRDLTVAQLIANCPDVPPFLGRGFHREPPCLLQETSTPGWVVDTERRLDREVFAALSGVVLSTGVVVGAGVCYYECDGPARTIATGTLLAAGVAGLLMLSVLYLFKGN